MWLHHCVQRAWLAWADFQWIRLSTWQKQTEKALKHKQNKSSSYSESVKVITGPWLSNHLNRMTMILWPVKWQRITIMIHVSLFRQNDDHFWYCNNHIAPIQQSISSCWWWLFRLVLTPSVSTTSTLPFASSSICLWILRIASKLRRAFSSLHSCSSMRQKSGGETELSQNDALRQLGNSTTYNRLFKTYS